MEAPVSGIVATLAVPFKSDLRVRKFPVFKTPAVIVKTPDSDVVLPKVIPPPLMVRFLTFPENKEAGKLKTLLFKNSIVESVALQSINPSVFETVPFEPIVNLFAPKLKFPDVKVKAPLTLTVEFMIAPILLFMVRLFIPVVALISVPKADPKFDAFIPSDFVKL